MPDFKKLLVWRKAHALSLEVERVASTMRGRHAALRNQMIRAADSIASNIVEGRGQESPRDFVRFLRYAVNSTSELEHHGLAARDKGALPLRDHEGVHTRLVEVRKMLYGLIRRIKADGE